jgi:hypothetical protein
MAPISRRSTTTFRPAPTREYNATSTVITTTVSSSTLPPPTTVATTTTTTGCVPTTTTSTTSTASSSTTTAAPPMPAGSYTKVVLDGEQDANSIIGSSSAPFANQMANAYGSATNFRTIVHPCLPNYVAARRVGRKASLMMPPRHLTRFRCGCSLFIKLRRRLGRCSSDTAQSP